MAKRLQPTSTTKCTSRGGEQARGGVSVKSSWENSEVEGSFAVVSESVAGMFAWGGCEVEESNHVAGGGKRCCSTDGKRVIIRGYGAGYGASV